MSPTTKRRPTEAGEDADVRRLTLMMSPAAEALLSSLASRLQAPEGSVMVWGLGLVQAALDAQADGKKLVILGRDGRAETEIVPTGAA